MGVAVGQLVGGKYRLLRQIGEGGMGSVWAAVHELLERNVAIKFLHLSGQGSTQASSAEASAHFEREAKSAAGVSHRYVVDVFDFGVTAEGVHYMVQELLSGEELARAMDEGPGWEARDVVRFMAQCLTALEAVHRAGLVHRDIKPENIFIARDAEGPFPKLLDFGICHVRAHAAAPDCQDRQDRKARSKGKGRRKSLPEMAQPAARPITQGTPAYMAPEQLRGLSDLDGRADLYSVAVTMYEWLSGRLPYEQLTPDALCTAIAARSALPLSELRPDLGEPLSAVIMRALSPFPAERFESAGDMRAALLATLPTLGSKTERILSAASCPFAEATTQPEEADEAAPALPMVGFWRSRGAYLGVAAACLTMLGVAAVPRTPAPFQQLDRAHASARADEAELREQAPASGAAILPVQAEPAQAEPVVNADSSAARAQQPAAPVARQVVLTTDAPAAEPASAPPAAAVASEKVARPVQARAKPASDEPARDRAVSVESANAEPASAELATLQAKVPAAEPVAPASDAQQARIERLEGGFAIAVQHVETVEPVVEERPLRIDLSRLGM